MSVFLQGDESDDSSIWKTYGPSIVFSAINICVPTVLELVSICLNWWILYNVSNLDCKPLTVPLLLVVPEQDDHSIHH